MAPFISGHLWVWWEPGAAAHKQTEHSSWYISTRAVLDGIFPLGKTELPAAHAVSLGMLDFQLGRTSSVLRITLQKLVICVLSVISPHHFQIKSCTGNMIYIAQ